MAAADCDYCEETFEDEEAYLRHLRSDHADELGPIEQRRVASLESDGGGFDPVTIAAVVGAVVLVGLIGFAFVSASGGNGDGGSAPTPHDFRSVHYHGTITASIDGQQLDFSRQQFQLQNDYFHFEQGRGERWHVHAKGVTLAYAMETLGIEVSEDELSYEGTTYTDESGTVVVEVNGESVDPSQYVLQRGDSVRIVANGS